MTFRHFALIGVSALALSSCSDTTQAQSPEELVAFMAWGVRPGVTTEPNLGGNAMKIQVEKTADKPLTFRLRVSMEVNGARIERDMMEFITLQNSDCVYTLELKPLDRNDRGYAPVQATIDFTNLKSVSHQAQTEQVVFEGAAVKCIGPDIDLCKPSKSKFSDGKWPLRLGPFDKAYLSRELLRAEVKKLTEAVVYFREHICKPS